MLVPICYLRVLVGGLYVHITSALVSLVLVGVINVHVTSALVSLVPVGIVVVVVGSGVVSHIPSRVVGAGVVLDVTSLGDTGHLQNTELGRGHSDEGKGYLKSTGNKTGLELL